MKGKKKNKRKVGKIILLCMSFLLTIVLTFTTTLAWFYDSDWASNSVTMAGTVGIDIRDKDGDVISDSRIGTSGSGKLHFLVSTDKAYPGQAIDVSASTYNNGGASKANGLAGSTCYVRAHFAVYTNIGLDDPLTEDIDEAALESEMNSRSLYNFLFNLVEAQNAENDTNYEWVYYANATAGNGQILSPSGTGTTDKKYYYEGTAYDTADAAAAANADNKGYFYLCYKSDKNVTVKNKSGVDTAITQKGVLKSLAVDEGVVFLWNSTFIIPWTLTNYSADKDIFVAVEFQAIQTFVPEINTGIIDNNANNQLSAETCYYYSKSVQTVFNSCSFSEIDLKVNAKDHKGDDIVLDFSDTTKYAKVSIPLDPGTHPSPTL